MNDELIRPLDEVLEVRRLLAQMASGADDGITGRSTLVVVGV